jgi:phosphate transport system ATP-binding protein
MNELVPNSRIVGEVLLDGINIYDTNYDVVTLRRQVGMIFQKPNPFPKSVYDNIAYFTRSPFGLNYAYTVSSREV